jgi:hypothetical protein
MSTGEFQNYRSVNPGITHVRFGSMLSKRLENIVEQ